MSVNFTPDQQQVIDLRGCNILVSAAAGSGKTAVLAQRIVKMVSDESDPVDIDRLLVVTFTGAAAAEMRERIGAGIGERLAQCPESEHLQRQMTLLHNAQITTIDSFCLFLVRNHFHEIGLDPAFRVADEQELKLLQQDVLAEVLESAFAAKDPAFLNCVEVLCHKGKEKVLEDQILNLSRYAASFPWPEEWLCQRAADYRGMTLQEFQKTPIFAYLRKYVSGILSGCADRLAQAAELAGEAAGPYPYLPVLVGEEAKIRALGELTDWEELRRELSGFAFGRLPSKKDDTISTQKREWVKKLREDVKKAIGELQEQFFAAPLQEMLRRGEACAEVAQALTDLVLDFHRRMREKKQEKKIIDFADMEHFALEILLERDGEEVRPSRVAKQYREYFHEILIDEYQDSNLVQEYLLRAVSGEEDGHFNCFMVGDVKQSIYRFRLARPELFLEKYDTYTSEGNYRRVDLSQNFRSRESVIGTVNEVFGRLMSRQIGGIVYDDRAALHPGALYPEAEGMQSELLVIEKPGEESEEDGKEAEARAIAVRIRELIKEGHVTDRETGTLRPVRYRDIVILLRSLSGWGEQLKEVLGGEGIPAYVTSKSGYFSAPEVQDLLNYLRVVDNPLQDIPLCGVLRSVFGGLREEEIACIRAGEKKGYLYDALKASGQEKAEAFLQRLERYREMAVYLPVRALMFQIMQEHDYLNYVTALPGGGKRRANLEMLLVKASDFEKTSYFGLFHFLRYIEQLEKYNEDYGEADTLEENADVVRIMSIHKSKGLEFPVVFVSALAKGFNLKDSAQAVILDMDLGIGMDLVDPVRRLRQKTLRKNLISRKLREDTLAEELRLFYVALTRAREKLILTCAVQDPEENLLSELQGRQERITWLDFIKAQSALDFIAPIFKKANVSIRLFRERDLACQEIRDWTDQEAQREKLKEAGSFLLPKEQEKLRERFAFSYPYESLRTLYTKTTVSELKIAAMSEKDEAAFHAFESRETTPILPQFRREKEEVGGAVRGNAYHKAMEILDFESVLGGQFSQFPESYEAYLANLKEERLLADLTAFLEEQTKALKLSQEYAQILNPRRLGRFLKAGIGYRMWRAYREGVLSREQPFVLAIPASRLGEAFPEEEKVLVQGIIDAYFLEEGKIVLLDYKTDVIPDAQALWNRYETQMDYYREALERLLNREVKERILYSFHLSEESAK